MKILNREEFLNLEDPVLFVKCDEYGNAETNLKISYGRSSEGSDDFTDIDLHMFTQKWGATESFGDSNDMHDFLSKTMKEKDSHFEWDYSMVGRDGLYDKDQKFMVYEKLDLLKLMRILDKTYMYSYHKDDYDCRYFDPEY